MTETTGRPEVSKIGDGSVERRPRLVAVLVVVGQR